MSLVIALLAVTGLAGAAPVHPSAAAAATGTTVFLNVSATPTFSFVPNQLSVAPGDSVHLKVTQEASFDHTFTLLAEAGFTFPSSATPGDIFTHLQAHPPLLNLSLGAVAGAATFANFTAPAAGTYQFLCVIPSHFQGGMFGTFTSSASSPSGPAPMGLSATTLYLIIGVVVVVVVVAVVAAVMMRRRPAAPRPPPSG